MKKVLEEKIINKPPKHDRPLTQDLQLMFEYRTCSIKGAGWIGQDP